VQLQQACTMGVDPNQGETACVVVGKASTLHCKSVGSVANCVLGI
jgi:hypothetical protein